jgi:glycosidase
MCWATQCHDEKRREHSAAAAEFYLYLSLILPGDKSVYYGEERGQQNNLSLADNDSYGRAPARGKIAWGSELERQQEDPDSFLNRYKRAIRFWRRNRAFLSDCTVELIETPSALRIVCYNNRRSMQFIFNESNQASERQVNDIPPFFKDSIMVLSGPSQALSLIKNLRLVIPPQSIVQLEGPAPPCAYERTA